MANTSEEIETTTRIISGAILYALAEAGEDQAVFLNESGGADRRLIVSEGLIDLNES